MGPEFASGKCQLTIVKYVINGSDYLHGKVLPTLLFYGFIRVTLRLWTWVPGFQWSWLLLSWADRPAGCLEIQNR